MKKIATVLIIIVVAFGLAGCNENPQEKQAADAAKANDAISKSTAAPGLVMPEKGKYKY